MSVVFVDTSGWIALLSKRDQFHRRAASRYSELAVQHSRLVTNNYVTDETATRLRYGLGLDAALSFHLMIRDAADKELLRVAWVDETVESRSWKLLEQYRDVKLSLTDATVAVMARAAKITEVFGCDRDFEALGFLVLPGSR